MLSNLFSGVTEPSVDERFDDLLKRPGVRVERILSNGQSSPPDFWYDQDEGEWVLVLSGSAAVRLEHEAEARVLGPGDFLDIPARCRHRVEWTDAGQPTLWLAVFYQVN
ncbi:MAG: cupin domain-containing protein [Paucimonas sp.]|jgi:cupin 2 domain-containing protein|nr:cupin domain-containing protein [Paucimonas sp.]